VQPFLALSESWGGPARPSGVSQLVVDLRCKTAGDLHKAWRPDQPRPPRSVCSWPHHPVLTVISP